MRNLLCPAASQTEAQAEASSRKNDKRKHSGSAFLTLCDDFCNARIELDAEVFSGAQMVALLLDEIEHFLHKRCGSIKGVLKLLANRGIELTERTLKDYITRARKLKGTEKGEAIAKLRESILEEARRSGRVPADRASGLPASQEEGAPAAQAASVSAEAPKAEEVDDWGTLDGGWLDSAVQQAMEQDEPQEQHKQDEQAQQEQKAKAAGASSAKKDKMAKKRARRRALLSR